MLLHPLSSNRWMLRVSGATLEDGAPRSLFRHATIETAPEALMERCTAAVGPSRASHRGVTAPAMAFGDLDVRG